MKDKNQPLIRSIVIDNENIRYSLKHSRRARYLRLQIRNSDELEVILPTGYNIKEAETFLLKNSGWIKKHIGLSKNKSENKYSLLGKEIKVVHEYDFFLKKHTISFKDGHIRITSPTGTSERTTDLFDRWLRRFAKRALAGRVYQLAGEMNFPVKKVGIRGQKTRWGSCSSKGNLSFNYNLLKFRKEVIDYVIIHELCHLKEMNHSTRFWKLVERFCPDYKTLRKELKEHYL